MRADLLFAPRVALVIAQLLAACTGHGIGGRPVTPELEPAPEPTVLLRVRVLRFTPDASHDDYIDGQYRSYDVTDLEVLTPQEYAGRIVSVLHDTDPAVDGPWRDVGAVYEMVMARELLSGGRIPYVGAFDKIRKITAQSGIAIDQALERVLRAAHAAECSVPDHVRVLEDGGSWIVTLLWGEHADKESEWKLVSDTGRIVPGPCVERRAKVRVERFVAFAKAMRAALPRATLYRDDPHHYVAGVTLWPDHTRWEVSFGPKARNVFGGGEYVVLDAKSFRVIDSKRMQ